MFLGIQPIKTRSYLVELFVLMVIAFTATTVACSNSADDEMSQSGQTSMQTVANDKSSATDSRGQPMDADARAAFDSASNILQDRSLSDSERRKKLRAVRRGFGDELFFSVINSVPVYNPDTDATITFHDYMLDLAAEFDAHPDAPLSVDPVSAATRIYFEPTEDMIAEMTGIGMSEQTIAEKRTERQRGVDGFVESEREIDAAVLIARSTASNDREAETRTDAAEELRTEFDNGDLDYEKAVQLIDTIAPDAAINERRDAARRLADLSQQGSEWNAERRLLAANELSRLVTGDSLEAEKRIKAARELVTKLDAGNLEPQEALNLMDRISPHSDIKKRAHALGSIARRFGEDGGNWDADDMMEFADELHIVTFGDDLDYEKRGRAAVDLAGEGIKKFGGDSYSDKEINDAGRVIKEAAFGDSDSLRGAIEDILGD